MKVLIVIVVLFALGWALLVRPQRRRQLAQRQMLDEVKAGDEILTAGGLYGYVRSIDEDDEVIVEIAPGTQVRLAKRAIAAVIPLEEEAEGEPGEPIDAEDTAKEAHR